MEKSDDLRREEKCDQELQSELIKTTYPVTSDRMKLV